MSTLTCPLVLTFKLWEPNRASTRTIRLPSSGVKQCAAETIHWSLMRLPSQAKVRSLSTDLWITKKKTIQGNSFGLACRPPMILLSDAKPTLLVPHSMAWLGDGHRMVTKNKHNANLDNIWCVHFSSLAWANLLIDCNRLESPVPYHEHCDGNHSSLVTSRINSRWWPLPFKRITQEA